ncbi:MAG: bifunctional (p)ppGpp synthetase/guanosine-3',5'-bis(diphosphate) 3'-pyrophosphohydrolase [Clostridia bacterium]|nr:bifunctional (p)ppGpp synthetase/guanosine-3',5'-bis(diphosphate) 3'-pyrophosphohydrolase [Clostridia bacterium]
MDYAFDALMEKIRKYNKNAACDEALLYKAYQRCREEHSNQLRHSGEPYFVHPYEVACILADMELDCEAIMAGLLHDVIEDTPFGYEQMKNEFGEQVAMLVEGVTKLDKIKCISKEEAQIENLRKMFFAMAEDIRVVLIKLADKLHNMRTLKHMKPEKQLEKAKEALDVYAPLAYRLGISKIKIELEDLALKHLDSVAYYEIVDGLSQKQSERDAYVQNVRDVIADKMETMGIQCHIVARAKHIYSIFRKMYNQNKTLDEIYDLFAVRIIVDTVAECYAVLGMVHEEYKPIPGRFKDYIAMPKPNMYQSLHTTVIGPDGQPFEIQIRTWDMHRVAERGVAAHWKYKEGKAGDKENLEWVNRLLEIQSEAVDPEEFMRMLKIDMFADEVFVFTPRGDVIGLPAGATPIDFAFYIHSAVGYRMTGAKVNSKIVNLDYKLQNGDIVEVITSGAGKGPSRDWLKIVKTSTARSKINSWFKKENREINIERGRTAVENEFKRVGMSQSDLFQSKYLEPMLRRYGFANVEEMYAAIGFGGITAAKVVTRLRDSYQSDHKEAEVITEISPKQNVHKNHKGDSGIEVRGVDNCLVRLSRCCNPVPGDDIIGFITKGRGVSVHRCDCINVQAEKMTDEMRARMIECSWLDDISTAFHTELSIECTNRNGILADVIAVVSEQKINLIAANARPLKDRTALIDITIDVTGKEEIDSIIRKLHRVPGVYEIKRTVQ